MLEKQQPRNRRIIWLTVALVLIIVAAFAFVLHQHRSDRQSASLLKGAGLTLGEFRLMGKTTEKEKPFGGLVEAVKK